MRYDVQRDVSGKASRGTYRPIYSDGQAAAKLSCPRCARTATVGGASGHSISADGNVTPSVSCPTDGCGFHQYIRLRDWPTP